MADLPDVKPCPFCGKPVCITLSTQSGRDVYYVQCENCGVGPMTVVSSSLEVVVRDWNNRPIEDALRAEIERLEEDDERKVEVLNRIVQWSEAYPIEVFPEPDFEKVAELLGGNLLSCVSASNMRHVITEVGKLARAALSQPDAPTEPQGGE